VPQVVQEPVDEVGSALSTRDPPRWRPTLAHNNETDPSSQGGRSPISLLIPDSPALESSVCASATYHGRTLESASLSKPSYHDAEHEQAALIVEPALEGQRATDSLIESSSDPQQDTPDTPDSTRSGDPQAEPRSTPGDEGEERSDQTNCYGESLKEATNGALEPASFVEDEQHVAQLRVQDIGEKGNEVDEDERVDGDEGDGKDEEEQTEQVEEEARGSKTSSSARVAGDVNNAHDVPSAEELVNVRDIASPSKTSAVPISLSNVVSTPRRELEHGMETGQSISNDLVTVQANATDEQAEQLNLTTHQRDDMEEARSHQSDGLCDEDEIVVANGPAAL
jgi:hypothetical protein